MSANDLRVASIMASVAESLGEAGTIEQTLSTITRCARETIPGVDFASITVRYRDGRLETLAPTDEITAKIDSLQYEFREGPCYDVASSEQAVSTADIGKDARWPTYGPAAAALGVRSQLAVRFYETPQSRGAMNLYSAGARVLTERVGLAQVFAKHAAIAMGHTYTVEGLNTALAGRKSIGQAIGIVMERYGLDEDHAFEFLMRMSQTANIKLRRVAAEVVKQANRSAAD
jgi:GAF domain-containing protein